MKEFCIQVDVTMSGHMYISANSKEEALDKLQKMNFTASDLSGFSNIATDVIDIEEE